MELENPRPPAPPERLAETARRLEELGRPLPPSYRAFLTEQDGGRPIRNTFSFEQDDEGMLAIAGDDFGNSICIDEDRRVQFWDHEEEYGNVSEVAPDLQAFIDGLTEPEPPPAAPEPERTGWRRRFGR